MVKSSYLLLNIHLSIQFDCHVHCKQYYNLVLFPMQSGRDCIFNNITFVFYLFPYKIQLTEDSVLWFNDLSLLIYERSYWGLWSTHTMAIQHNVHCKYMTKPGLLIRYTLDNYLLRYWIVLNPDLATPQYKCIQGEPVQSFILKLLFYPLLRTTFVIKKFYKAWT